MRLISIFFLVYTFWIGSIGPVTAMTPIKRISLPNKMVVLLSEEHSLPFVTLQLIIDGGSRQDPRGKEGLAFLTAKGLLWGTAEQKNGQDQSPRSIGHIYISSSLDQVPWSRRDVFR